MENVFYAMAPAFAAGFAIQQLIELLDSIIGPLSRLQERKRKMLFSTISLSVALIIVYAAKIRILNALGVGNACYIDIFVSTLIISAGTEGFNSIMKYMGYAKKGYRHKAGHFEIRQDGDFGK